MTAPDPAYAAFLRDLDFVLAREGGLVDDPADPGGRTNRGVTQRVYDAWRAAHGQPAQDVARISDVECAQIYWSGYYRPCGAPALPPALRLITFDTAVNMGVERAARWAQAALAAPSPPDALLYRRQVEYAAIARRRPILRKFLRGWYQRLRVLRRTLHLPADPQLDAVWRAA